ncbi:ABC transporter substrate-binding protein [Phenylobacterium sp.]|uniref:ABC transporter substrate-binding protein n=1 Tax=Phenylobacterium sp. TaxID=1871053 RepID=UPI0011FF6ED3|nr:ABC transporter substrate-binding protein [Phenylobacterium sp.]THD61310.1 MAG: hopanoid biosynthesis protein HpnM [Phenylobacterium sp.]
MNPMRYALSSALALAVAFAAAPPAVHAQAADPAAAQIEKFDDALLDVMKRAKALGPRGRFDALQPAVERAFDLPAMTRFAVGTTWASVPADQQAELIKAFSRMTVATYARNFDGYGGEKFSVGKVDTRGPDKLVHTLLSGGGDPTNLAYRMRESGGAWKVIDVYYNTAVSSLLGQRSEYASTLSAGGAPALVKKLNARADQLLQPR